MIATPSDPVEIDCQVKRKTAQAWLVDVGGREVWIPASQVSDYTETMGLFGSQISSVFVPLWLAREKGLV